MICLFIKCIHTHTILCFEQLFPNGDNITVVVIRVINKGWRVGLMHEIESRNDWNPEAKLGPSVSTSKLSKIIIGNLTVKTHNSTWPLMV